MHATVIEPTSYWSRPGARYRLGSGCAAATPIADLFSCAWFGPPNARVPTPLVSRGAVPVDILTRMWSEPSYYSHATRRRRGIY